MEIRNKCCIMPEMPYCPACPYGLVLYSSDEVECVSDLEGASSEWVCCLPSDEHEND